MTKQKSDLSRAFSEDGAIKTHVGGQALIEGVMMRGKYNWAVAVREPDGAIYVEEHDLTSGKDKNGWMYWPLVRGCRALVESLMLGFKALEIAALHAFGDEEGEQKAAAEATDEAIDYEVTLTDGSETENEEADFGHREMVISMVVGLVLGVVLFIVAPAAITNLIVGEYDDHTLAWNIVDGLLRVAVFVFYIWLIGRMEDIKRMFMYHGAEHKAIHCFEHGLPMTPDNARQFPRLHVRCGTAFLIMVMVIAILVYTIFPLNAIIYGEVGRQSSGQPAREGNSVARHADAVPHHPRARRRPDGVRHRRHAGRARSRGCRGGEGGREDSAHRFLIGVAAPLPLPG